MNQPHRLYRVLSVVSCLVSLVALAEWYLVRSRLVDARRALAAQAEASRLPDPHEIAKQRDQNFDFVIHNYGFEYEGRTGEMIDDWVLYCGVWEKDLAFFMRDYLLRRGNEQAVLIDVGCNAGQHSLFLSRYVKQIHAFDPYPPVVERFRKLIARNGFTNILVHQVGLGVQDEEKPFFAPIETNQGSGTFSEAFRQQAPDRPPAENMRIVRGDDWLAQYQLSGVELIKIDVEGFEEYALQGLRKTLEAHRPAVLVELSKPPAGTVASLAQLRKLLPTDYDFLVFVANQKTELSGDYRLRDFVPVADAFFTNGTQVNLLAFPSEKAAEVPRERTSTEKASTEKAPGSEKTPESVSEKGS